jgi:hypothetical protein
MWSFNNGPDVPTPVTDGTYTYVVNDRGILWCLDARTGKEIYGQQRLRPGTYSGSFVLADGKLDEAASLAKLKAETTTLFKESYIEHLREYHQTLMEKVAELSTRALTEWGLGLIIFPEGTRSIRLGEGRIGIAQIALYSGKKIIPVGCNNSDTVYTGHSPFAKTGAITYRIGDPLDMDGRLKEFRITEPFKLFSRESQQKYRAQFEGVTRVVMDSLNELLDERHRRERQKPQATGSRPQASR